MRSQDRYLLEYRPKLEWQVDILGVVEAIGLPEDTVDSYQMPDEIKTLLDNPAAEAFRAVTDLLNTINTLKDDLSICLHNTGGFLDYKESLENNNLQSTDQYLNYYTGSLGGSTQAEVYYLLHQMMDEFNDLSEYIANEFFGENLSNQSIDSIRSKELMFFNDVVAGHMSDPSNSALAAYPIRAAMVRAMTWRVINAQVFVDDLSNVLKTTLNDHYSGQIVDLVAGLIDTPGQLLDQMQQMNEVAFTKASGQTAEIMERMQRLNSPQYKDSMQVQAKEMAELKLTGINVMKWAENLDLDNDNDPFVSYIGDVAIAVQEIEEAFENQLVDLYKFNMLDERIKSDYVRALQEKRKIRQIHNIIADIRDSQVNNSEPARLVADKFVKAQSLQQPGTICTEYTAKPGKYALPAVEPGMLIQQQSGPAPGIPSGPGGGGGGSGGPVNTNELLIGSYRVAFNPSNKNLEVFYTETQED